MNGILAFNIIYSKEPQDVAYICGCQSLTEGPIHIHLFLSFLKIDKGAWGKTSMSCTCMPTYSRTISGVVGHISVQLGSVPMTTRRLSAVDKQLLIPTNCLYIAYHFYFFGFFQMYFISVGVGHKPLSACEPYIGPVVFLLQVIGWEISIRNKAPHEEIAIMMYWISGGILYDIRNTLRVIFLLIFPPRREIDSVLRACSTKETHLTT